MINSTGLSIIDFNSISQYNINSDVDAMNLTDTTSNFNVKLSLDWINQYDRISVGNLVIPKSFYLINSNNNTFTIKKRLTNGTETNYLIQLAIGNYNTPALLVTEINSKLNILALVGLTCAYSGDSTAKLIFSIAGATATIYFIIFSNTLYEVFGGFSPAEDPNGSRMVVIQNLPYTMPYMINLNAYNNMYLLCDMVSANNSQESSNVLAALYPHTASTYSYSVEDFDILQNSKKISKRTNVLNFQIVDSFKQLIDFNGIACSFSIYFFKLKN